MTQQGIKAIETVYNGYRFRSRLGARWAVFFDALGVKYEYEKEGYDLGEVGWYLPDFWLETVHMWAEVKPDAFTEEEYGKCALLARGTRHAVLMLDGMPDHDRLYSYVEWTPEHTDMDEIYPGATIENTFSGDWFEVQVTLDDSYLHSEHRWWSSEGHRASECDASDTSKTAYLAARQARFEHGEAPQVPHVSDYVARTGARVKTFLARPWRERQLEMLIDLREQVTNFEADWDAHLARTRDPKRRTPEYKERWRREVAYRLQSEELKLRMADLDERHLAIERTPHSEEQQQELIALLTEKQTLLAERRRIDTAYFAAQPPRKRTVNKL